MKRFLLFATFVCAALFTACEGYDDSELVNRLDNFENRLKKLEELCSQMNTNISSLQTIVNAIQKNDQITAIAPINKDGKEIGYTIVFTSGKSITIYHGSDGKDGQDGADGKDGADGHTPIIGVKQDTDGNYYWTLDGEWLTDDNGNKIRANGTDGKDGADGADGENGADGKDGEDGTDGKDGENGTDGKNGADGITPQLKIENDYWYVSYDNGATWKQLGKATGEDGKDGADGKDGVDGTNGTDGADGKDGADGDSFFKDIIEDEENVYFILADGTTITIAKSKSIELTYIPRYSDGKATVFYSTKEDSYVEFDFEVSPASAADDWSNFATIKAVYTQTRANVNFVNLDIINWAVDTTNGTITVKASGANLCDDFFANIQEASARLVIQSEKINVISNYIPMIAQEIASQPTNKIFYTSSDGNIVEPYNSNVFGKEIDQDGGVKIISNTYNNGFGIIEFDSTLTTIGYEAFKNCYTLVSIDIPNTVNWIGAGAFSGCGLKDITLPNKITRISGETFTNCGFTNIYIPNSVTSIGFGAFESTSLKSINIPNNVTIIEGEAFKYCYDLEHVTLPNNLKTIEGNAFRDCNSLTNITIPANVTEIGDHAFSLCFNLNVVTCLATTPPTLGWAVFDLNNPPKFFVPKGSGEAYKNASSWADYADMIEEKEM